MATEKNRKFRFNVLDVIIVLFVFAVIAGVLLRNNILDTTIAKTSSVPIEFSVKLEGVREYTYNAIEVGQKLYDDETGNALGKITKVDLLPFNNTVTLNDGSVISRQVPNRHNVIIYVTGEGKVSDEGYYINGNRLVSPNGSLDVSTQKVITQGKFVEANEAK